MNNETTNPNDEMSRRELIRLAAGATAGLIAAGAYARSAEAVTAPPAPQKPVAKMPKHDMTGYGIPEGPPQQIAMLIYPEMTALDLIGPNQILSSMGNVEVHLVWKSKAKPVLSDAGVPITATRTFKDCPKRPMILFVPGGSQGTLAVMKDRETLDFLRAYGNTAKYVTSVCTGSLILGAAGLLNGYKATSHWSLRDEILPLFGATPIKARVVEDRNRITGAGVTAGLDFALTLAAKLRNEKMARAIQLTMEYDPAPPFNAGSPDTAGADVTEMMQAMMYPLREEMKAVAVSLARGDGKAKTG